MFCWFLFLFICLSVCIAVGWRKGAAPLNPLSIIASTGGLGTCRNGGGARRIGTISCCASLSSGGLISNQHAQSSVFGEQGVFCPTWFSQAECKQSLQCMENCLPRSWEIKLNTLTTLYCPGLSQQVASLQQILESQNSYIRKISPGQLLSKWEDRILVLQTLPSFQKMESLGGN